MAERVMEKVKGRGFGQPAGAKGFFDFFTGKERATPATEELPELGSGGLLSSEDKSTVAAITPAILTATNPAEIAQILSGIPSIGIQEDEKGNLIAGNNKTGVKVVINKPGLSKLDIVQSLGIMSAFTPAGRVATMGTEGAKIGAGMVGRRVAQGAGASALTEAGLQAAQEAAGGEFDTGEVVTAGVTGGLAETVSPAIQGMRNIRRAKKAGVGLDELADIQPAIKQAETAQAGLKRSGADVDLFPAQKTAIPSALEEQSFVGMLPAGSQKARKALIKQNKQVAKAVDNILDTIAKPSVMETGPERFRKAAESAIEYKRAMRSSVSSPLFEKAFDSGVKVDLSPVDDAIQGILSEYPKKGGVAKAIREIAGMLENPSLKTLHNAKMEIDDMLMSVGDDSLGRTAKRKIGEVRELLVQQMDLAGTPGDIAPDVLERIKGVQKTLAKQGNISIDDLEGLPEYAKARIRFQADSPAVNQVENSILGKIAKLDDTQLKTISRKVFDPAETNAQTVAQAKKAIADVDPEAWNDLLRVEIERRLGVMRGDLAEASNGVSASVENLPGQLQRAIFGNAKQKNILYTAADKDTRKMLYYLETALNRAKLGRPGGSQTATREEIKKRLEGGVVSSIRNFFSKPLETVTGVGAEAAFDRKTRKMADILFDPQYAPQRKKLLELKADTPAAARAMAQLLREDDE
jgi:hypothetical protein